MGKDWPPLLQFLNEELGYRVRPAKAALGYELFFIDLSSWKLSLSDRTPVIWVRASDLEGTAPLGLLQSLLDLMRARGFTRRTVLVLMEGDGRPLLKYTTSPLYSLVIIGSDDQQRIRQSRRPSGELLDLISAQVPISNLAPYETRAPVTGPRFFGREYEKSRILANPHTNHVILGIRRIGKTSLLREIERILADEGESPHVVYMDCSDLLSADDYIREVVRKLNPKELPRLHLQKYVFWFPDFLERMHRRHKKRLVFLLDEIDNLVIMQRGSWELFRMLRASSNKGACQYIIAGFREAMQEQHLLDSPFYNFAQEIRLSEFSRQQAHDLIVTPMENLRVRFKNKDEVVGRICEETAGHPNLIQYYCTILLRRLDQTGERELGPNNLIDVYSDEGFKSHLLSSFMENTENREKAVVYALLGECPECQSRYFTQAQIDDALRQRALALSQNDIDEACNVLALAGVFQRKGRDYSFTSPVFARVLQETYDVQYLLSKVREEGL
jgi:hypothetical protein